MVLGVYDETPAHVLIRLDELGFVPTGRLQTTGTVVGPLWREQGRMGLKGVHDVAGARIVVAGSRLDQDDAAASIVEAFRGDSRSPVDPTTSAIEGHPEITRERMVRSMQQIDRSETVRVDVLRAEGGLETASNRDSDEYRALLGDRRDLKDELAELEAELRATRRVLVRYATQEARSA